MTSRAIKRVRRVVQQLRPAEPLCSAAGGARRGRAAAARGAAARARARTRRRPRDRRPGPDADRRRGARRRALGRRVAQGPPRDARPRQRRRRHRRLPAGLRRPRVGAPARRPARDLDAPRRRRVGARRARHRARGRAGRDPRAGCRGPARAAGEVLVRRARARVRDGRRRRGPRGVRDLRPPHPRGRPGLGRGGEAPRLDARVGRRRPRLADRPEPRPADVRRARLRAPVGEPRVGQHRRPHPEHRLARAPRAPHGRPPARRGRARRAARAAARAHAAGAAAHRRRRRPRGDRRAPRRVDLPGDSRGHVDARLRLVHAPALQLAPRVPAAPQPAADLRLLPLQQAVAAHARGDRVPQALRAGRLPRLDDRVPAALDRRAGLLLGLPDDDDRHRVPGGPRGARRGAGRVRRRRRRSRGRGRLPPQRPRRAHAQLRRQHGPRAGAAGDLPHAPPDRSSRRGCTATCRSARSASTSSSGPRTRPTCASTGWPGSTTLPSAPSARASTTSSSRSWARSSRAGPRPRSTGSGASSPRTTWRRPSASARSAPGCGRWRSTSSRRSRARRRAGRRRPMPCTAPSSCRRAAASTSRCSSPRCSSTPRGRCTCGSSAMPAPAAG